MKKILLYVLGAVYGLILGVVAAHFHYHAFSIETLMLLITGFVMVLVTQMLLDKFMKP